MVATSNVALRIEQGLGALIAEVNDLPNLAKEWEELPDWNRASISLDWDHLLADYLTELERVYRGGAMTPDQQARYRELRCKIRAALPLFERLRFLPIPVPLED
ncbi:MAG: hypothetical protein H0V51_04080 [Chloroflexi bacterium]|nr:hypothetical protein [Chloroflexota bacterium]